MRARASTPSPLYTQLIGNSAAMRQVAHLIAQMALSEFPALILGETGTGKEVVARAIHNGAARGPFVVVDCSALVGPLMESELFGYAKGAFTGAHVQKLGLLDAANGGTAFFDEIGELPLDMQQKLLRVLQQKEFRAVGGLAERSSNFRVIAATNRDLPREVEKGRFRQDLYYRLNVMKLRIPPLRERKEDIPSLVSYFLQRYGYQETISPSAMEALMEHDWPGNVRELEHAVQRMIAIRTGPEASVIDLPTVVQNRHTAGGVRDTVESTVAIGASDKRDQQVLPLAEVEKRAILHALEVSHGDRTVAAAMLDIGRTTLYRKLKEYGL